MARGRARVWKLALAALVGGGCGNVLPQHLGTPAATPWMHERLSVTVPARLAAGDDCVQAAVAYGERLLDTGQVRASVEGAGARQFVRVVAREPIDEPVVTLTLRAGCGQPMTQVFTLLPDLRPVAAAIPQASVRDATPRVRVRDNAPARRAMRPASRLQLVPLDDLVDVPLRLSPLLSQPAGDPSRRAAAALRWQALRAEPLDMLRTATTLRALDAEVTQLQLSRLRTDAELALLRADLEAPAWQAGASRAAAWSIAFLAAVLLALALYGRRRHAAPWWRGAASERDPEDSLVSVSPFTPEDLARMRRALQAEAQPPVPSAPAPPPKPPRARSGAGRMQRAHALATTLEEADALAFMGLRSDAAQVLETYLGDHPDAPPLVLLELLRLCLPRSAAARNVQLRYRQVFGTHPPPLQEITATQGIEGEADLCRRICEAWGSPRALQILEHAVFGTRWRPQLTLEAARELLCLYTVALQRMQDEQPAVDVLAGAPGRSMPEVADLELAD